MTIADFYNKVTYRLKGIYLSKVENTLLQFRSFRCYWHFLLSNKGSAIKPKEHYITQKPNPGAGIGHQLANWNSGYYFASYFHKNFAHSAFSDPQWEAFLGFGEKEQSALSLMNDRSFKKINLPRFDSTNASHIELIGRIIHSYSKDKVLFLLAQDQGYVKQYETMDQLSEKFFSAAARKNDHLFYDRAYFNIAIHIRRGDIVAMKENNVSNGNLRWLDNAYYVEVLKQVLKRLDTSKAVRVYLFSQGVKEDFKEFNEFYDIQYCLDANQYDTFLHLVNADLLISSKSSFSYKPALISKGIKVCPKDFWHGYPENDSWMLADETDFSIHKNR